MAHPIRGRILSLLADEEGQSAADLAEGLSLPVRSVRHQLSRLAEDGLLEVIGSRERRGAREKFYEVRVTPILETADFETMTPQIRRLATAESFRPMVRDIEQALEAGSFFWNDSTQARIGAEVDEEGWRVVAATMGAAYKEIEEVAERAAYRMEASGGAGRTKQALFGLLWFERPRPVDPGWDPPTADLLPARQMLMSGAAVGGKGRDGHIRSLARAMAHPIRFSILAVLSDTHPLSIAQVAERTGQSRRRARYHLGRLIGDGLVQEIRGRGRGRNRYTLRMLPILWTEELEGLGPEESNRIAAEIFRRILIDVAGAISAGTFSRRTDFCQIRMPVAVDDEGWDEIQALSVDLLGRVEAAHGEAADRLRETGEEPIAATAAIVWVELPAR